MKKIICMAAVLFAAFSMVSCGGSSSGGSSSDSDSKESSKELTVEEKAEEFVKKMFELTEKNDYEGYNELSEEIEKYREGLSKEDKKAFDKAGEKAALAYQKMHKNDRVSEFEQDSYSDYGSMDLDSDMDFDSAMDLDSDMEW